MQSSYLSPSNIWGLGHSLCFRFVRPLVRARVLGWEHSPTGLPSTSSYSATHRGAEYRDERVCLSVCVCVCVWLSTIISSELHIQSSPNCLTMLPMAVARFSSGGVVICYVLPVLWMTSYLLISQGCSTSPPSWTTVHTQPWAWIFIGWQWRNFVLYLYQLIFAAIL